MSVTFFQDCTEPLAGAMHVGPIVTTRRANLRLSLFEQLHAVEATWRAFERVADCTAFQAFDWLAAWQRHIGARRGVRPAIVIGQSLAGEMLFLLPLAVERFGGVRRLTFFGHDLCDYNAPLLAADFERAVGRGEFLPLWEEIRALLQRQPALRHDAVRLTKMPETVGGQLNPFLQLKVDLEPNAAYVTRLGTDWEEFYRDKRSSATRRKDRKKRLRLAQYGDVRFVGTSAVDEAAHTLQTLMQQKRTSLARIGVADIFERPGHREFYLELVTNPTLRGLVHMSRLDVGHECAATNLGLIFRGCYYHVLASYADGPMSRVGPGTLHLRDLLRYAIERRLERFDFTIGDEPYKREWSDETVRLFDHTAAATWRGLPATLASTCLRKPKRLIKQNPRLNRLMVAIRAAALRQRRVRDAEC